MTTTRQNIVVTGGAGFLGLYLVRRLIENGHHVVVLDSLATSSPTAERQLFNMGAVLIRADVTQPMPLDRIKASLLSGPHGHTVDAVAHLACPASPVDYWKRPVWTMRTCSEGTWRTLDMAQHLGSPNVRFLLASTSEVYGDPGVEAPEALPEGYHGDVAILGERSMYDEGKRFAETLTMEMGIELQLDVRIARIFNTYGPGMRHNDGRMAPGFVLAALRGEAMPIHGDGQQRRTMTYVDDTIDGLAQLLMRPAHEVPTFRVAPSKRTVPVFNICGTREHSVEEVAHEVWHAVRAGPRPGLQEVPQLAHQEHPSPHDPKRRLGDTTRLRSMGWAPRVSLQEGLIRLATWAAQDPEWMLAAETREFVW